MNQSDKNSNYKKFRSEDLYEEEGDQISQHPNEDLDIHPEELSGDENAEKSLIISTAETPKASIFEITKTVF